MSCHGNFKNFDFSEDERMSDGLKFQHVKVKAGNLSNMIEKQSSSLLPFRLQARASWW